MKIVCILILSVWLTNCSSGTLSKCESLPSAESSTNVKWLEKRPEFRVEYQTGFSEGDKILVPGDFYLVTSYTAENIEVFQGLSSSKLCQLLNNPTTRTNCVLLLNQINLISNLDNENTTYEEWESTIALTQLPMWNEKCGCDK